MSLISTGTETICFARRFDPGTHWDHWVQYPFRPGYSTVARVEEVGEGVTGLQPGDRDFDDFALRIDIAPVPLPAAGFLLLAGLGAMGAVARRRKA